MLQEDSESSVAIELSSGKNDAEVHAAPLPRNHVEDNFSSNTANSTTKSGTIQFQDHRVQLDSLNYKESQTLQLEIIISFLCLLNVGMAEQTTGVLIRYLMDYYSVGHSIVSIIFLVQFMGFVLAACINDFMHQKFGLRGTILSAQLACVVCFGICMLGPPLPIFIFFYFLNGYSTGCQNSTFNSWGGKLEYHNQIMGLLHSAYGIGSIISPILATHLLERLNGKWQIWYLILSADAALLSVLSYFGFKNETSWKYRYELYAHGEDGDHSNKKKSIMLITIKEKLIWLFSFVLFLYVGGEVTLGNWVYNYLIDIKDLTARQSSFITSGYWLAMTIGRLVLGFAIGQFYEDDEARILAYIAIAIAIGSFCFTVITWLPLQVVSVIWIGVMIGPIFPTVAIVALKKLPTKLHVSGVSFISSIGGTGGGIIPFVIGLVSSIASKTNGDGLVWFPLIVLMVFSLAAICWVGYWIRSRKGAYEEL